MNVGQMLPAFEAPPVSRATLALFAGASGDHNPVHIDTDAAKAAGYDDVFAQGMLSMAYLAQLLTNWVPQSRIRELRGRFLAITPVHARPTCTGEVVSTTADGLIRVDLRVTLADGTTTMEGSALVSPGE